MERKHFNKELRLLPQYFKKVGVITMIVAIIPFIFFAAMHINLSESQKNILSIFTYDIFITGLSLLAFSKDKVEDEMTIHIRLRSMAFAFMWTIFSVMLTPIFNLLFKVQANDSAREIVLTMLVFYLLMFYIQKVRR